MSAQPNLRFTCELSLKEIYAISISAPVKTNSISER